MQIASSQDHPWSPPPFPPPLLLNILFEMNNVNNLYVRPNNWQLQKSKIPYFLIDVLYNILFVFSCTAGGITPTKHHSTPPLPPPPPPLSPQTTKNNILPEFKYGREEKKRSALTIMSFCWDNRHGVISIKIYISLREKPIMGFLRLKPKVYMRNEMSYIWKVDFSLESVLPKQITNKWEMLPNQVLNVGMPNLWKSLITSFCQIRNCHKGKK